MYNVNSKNCLWHERRITLWKKWKYYWKPPHVTSTLRRRHSKHCSARVTSLQRRRIFLSPVRSLANVSILGPVRPATQVELSATDARSIGCPIFVRESGDIAGTPGCKITGPEGEIEISEGVIVAKRHIHLVPETAEKWGVKNKDVVSVKVDSDGRKAILGDVVIRVSENFADAMHIDTDESNAVMAAPGMMVEVIKSPWLWAAEIFL